MFFSLLRAPLRLLWWDLAGCLIDTSGTRSGSVSSIKLLLGVGEGVAMPSGPSWPSFSAIGELVIGFGEFSFVVSCSLFSAISVFCCSSISALDKSVLFSDKSAGKVFSAGLVSGSGVMFFIRVVFVSLWVTISISSSNTCLTRISLNDSFNGGKLGLSDCKRETKRFNKGQKVPKGAKLTRVSLNYRLLQTRRIGCKNQCNFDFDFIMTLKGILELERDSN